MSGTYDSSMFEEETNAIDCGKGKNVFHAIQGSIDLFASFSNFLNNVFVYPSKERSDGTKENFLTYVLTQVPHAQCQVLIYCCTKSQVSEVYCYFKKSDKLSMQYLDK